MLLIETTLVCSWIWRYEVRIPIKQHGHLLIRLKNSWCS